MPTPNLAQLRRAVEVAQQIEKLQGELASILRVGGSAGSDLVIPAPKEKRTMSRAARAKFSRAAKARWANTKNLSGETAPPDVVTVKKKRKMSAKGRANIAAAQRARWAAKNKTAKEGA